MPMAVSAIVIRCTCSLRLEIVFDANAENTGAGSRRRPQKTAARTERGRLDGIRVEEIVEIDQHGKRLSREPDRLLRSQVENGDGGKALRSQAFRLDDDRGVVVQALIERPRERLPALPAE